MLHGGGLLGCYTTTSYCSSLQPCVAAEDADPSSRKTPASCWLLTMPILDDELGSSGGLESSTWWLPPAVTKAATLLSRFSAFQPPAATGDTDQAGEDGGRQEAGDSDEPFSRRPSGRRLDGQATREVSGRRWIWMSCISYVYWFKSRWNSFKNK